MSRFQDQPPEAFLWIVSVIVIALTAGFLQDSYATKRTIKLVRQEAVKAGAALFTVNPETGETKFEWIKCEKQAK